MTLKSSYHDDGSETLTRAEIEKGYEPLLRAVSSNEYSLSAEKLKQALEGTEWSRRVFTVPRVRHLLAERVHRPTVSLIAALCNANELARLAQWQRHNLAAESKAPPHNAEFIGALFIKQELREYVIGCRAEAFGHSVAKYGRRRAVFLYWWDIASSLRLPLWAFLKRSIGAGIVADLYRRVKGL
jgi:hypothetical protein